MREIIETIKQALRDAVKATALLALGLALLLGASREAKAQIGVVPRYGQFTNAGTLNVTNASGGSFLLVAGAGSATVTSSNMTVYRGRGLAIWPRFAFTNSGTETVGLGFNVSYDGTNFSTATPLWATFLGNGATGVLGYSLLQPTVLDNIKAIQLTTITNGHASSLFITNVIGAADP